MGFLADVLGAPGQLQGYIRAGRDRVLDPLRKAQEQAAYDLQQQRAAAILQQRGVGLAEQLNRQGLTGDPTAQTAVGLMQSPGSREAGANLAQWRLDPAAQQGYGAAQANQAQGAAEAERQAKLFPGQLQAQTDAHNSAIASQAANWAQQKAALDGIGALPPAMISQVTTATQNQVNQNQGIAAADTLAGMWESAGLWDAKLHPEIQGQAQQAMNNVIPLLIAKMQSGVLNPTEYERYAKMIGDPTSITERIMTRDPAAIALLKGLASDGRAQRDALFKTPLGKYLDPALAMDSQAPWKVPEGFGQVVQMPTVGTEGLGKGGTQRFKGRESSFTNALVEMTKRLHGVELQSPFTSVGGR